MPAARARRRRPEVAAAQLYPQPPDDGVDPELRAADDGGPRVLRFGGRGAES